MKKRSLGWIQNPSNTRALHNIVSVFVYNSNFNKRFRKEIIPVLRKLNLLEDKNKFKAYLVQLSQPQIVIKYEDLKGKGSGSCSRRDAKCSGIIQACVEAQKYIEIRDSKSGVRKKIKKPYIDDWSADGFLRWAISIGFLDYDAVYDTCAISERGIRFVRADTAEKKKQVLGEAYLSYPPSVRILKLLRDNGHLTKFEIGRELGFVGEDGFTSIDQALWIEAVNSTDADEAREARQNMEGSADKYARMISKWLAEIGWVSEEAKEVKASICDVEYSANVAQAFRITSEGLKNLKRAEGKSSKKRIAKIVYYEMLATKVPDKEYIRMRRGYILKYLQSKQCRTLKNIRQYLLNNGFEENTATIKDDIVGLYQIGLNIVNLHGGYRLYDDIAKFVLPIDVENVVKTDASILKAKVADKLKKLDHRYLVLLDLSRNGKANREFEIETMGLMTKALEYKGKHLGGSRRPDGIIYYGTNGVIIDTKAYSQGYALPRGQVDEMARYVEENTKKDTSINTVEWWKAFPDNINKYNYLFVSSSFSGRFQDRLQEIANRTSVNGGAITAENLLYFAEKILTDRLSYKDSFGLLEHNDEIKINIEDSDVCP